MKKKITIILCIIFFNIGYIIGLIINDKVEQPKRAYEILEEGYERLNKDGVN